MRKLPILGLLFALLAVSAPSAKAQTTYTLNKPFVCDAESLHPIFSFYQFVCRINNPYPFQYYGIVFPNFLDPSGNKVEFYRFPAEIYVIPTVVNGTTVTTLWTVYNATYQLTRFSLPTTGDGSTNCGYKGNTYDPCTVPGTATFTWQGTDTSTTPPTPHNGTVSWTWFNYQICGGRGCEYFAPQLQPGSTVTVN